MRPAGGKAEGGTAKSGYEIFWACPIKHGDRIMSALGAPTIFPHTAALRRTFADSFQGHGMDRRIRAITWRLDSIINF